MYSIYDNNAKRITMRTFADLTILSDSITVSGFDHGNRIGVMAVNVNIEKLLAQFTDDELMHYLSVRHKANHKDFTIKNEDQ